MDDVATGKLHLKLEWLSLLHTPEKLDQVLLPHSLTLNLQNGTSWNQLEQMIKYKHQCLRRRLLHSSKAQCMNEKAADEPEPTGLVS